MNMKDVVIYHGSQNIIEKPMFGYGKPYNDYGLGFYCTESLELAKEWAVNSEQSGYANKYEFHMEALKVLYLNEEPYCILHWLALLLNNRKFETSIPLAKNAKEYILNAFLPDISEYDVIIGYRADDSYFSYAQDFISGAISYSQLNEAMHLGQLGEQIVLKSEKAFGRLKFMGYEYADTEEWYVKKATRDAQARDKYLSSERNTFIKGEIYVTRILEEEMKPSDTRLR